MNPFQLHSAPDIFLQKPVVSTIRTLLVGLLFLTTFSHPGFTQDKQFAPQLAIIPGVGFDVRSLSENLYLGTPVSLEFQSKPAALKLHAPIFWNLSAPTLNPSDPAACALLRCDDWWVNGELDVVRVSRVIQSFRLGHGDSDFFVRGGALDLRLGQGLLVNGYHNQIHWDLRTSGVYGRSAVWGTPLQIAAFAGSFLGAPSLFGGRVSASHPLGVGAFKVDWGVEGIFDPYMNSHAADLGHMGDLNLEKIDRRLGAGAADVALSFDLLEQLLVFKPYMGTSVLNGFSHYGQSKGEWGLGGLGGLQLWLTLPWVGLYVETFLGGSSDAHYFAPFDVTYELDKRLSLVPTTTEGDNFLFVPRAGGINQGYEVGFQWSDALTGSLKLRIPPQERGALFHGKVQWQSSDLQLGAQWISKKRWTAIQADHDPSVALMEGAMRIFDDWSIWGRYAYCPHLNQGQEVMWQNTHDALFGVMWRRQVSAK